MQTQEKPASRNKPTSPPALAGAAALTSDTVASVPVPGVVPSTEQWTDTGIDLSVDDGVLIEVDGAITPRAEDVPLYGRFLI